MCVFGIFPNKILDKLKDNIMFFWFRYNNGFQRVFGRDNGTNYKFKPSKKRL